MRSRRTPSLRTVTSALAAVAALLAASGSLAQTGAPAPRWPTEAEIDRARREHPLPAPEATAGHAPTPPRVGQLPAPASSITSPGPGIDLATLAQQGSRLGAQASAPAQAAALRVFITLDVPQESLRRLVEQAERAGAVLVLRGLRHQSMRQTLAALSELIGQRRVGWLIDPEAFERHGVQAAPTFVLTLGNESAAAPACGASACLGAGPFVSVAGDVSLDYALDHMARRHPGAAPVAAAYLARLRPR
jgi:conjugal transfer pilus assembly protein TrbC